ncbi:MAG: prepilin peptidase [Firmicutes bacterium]|nr:prepilin peptidase [Bacillota bacterium]MCL5038953.1 prepilin peptidase [Bacillota bacterium]
MLGKGQAVTLFLHWPLILMLSIVGLLLGSFLNVVIHRLPRGESIVFPPSHCPRCGARLGPLELIPVVSYIVQKGRCRHCRASISWRYPLVELVTAGLFLLFYLRYGPSPQFLFYASLATLLVPVTFIDLEHQIIPNSLNLTGLAVGLPLLLWLRPLTWSQALLGLVAGGGLLLVVATLSWGGMGGGDVKLAGVLGFYLGWPLVLLALLLAFVAGALIGLFLLATRIKGRRDFIPFGPFLALGAIITLLAGPEMVVWYLSHLR